MWASTIEEHDRRQHEAGEPDHGRNAGRSLRQRPPAGRAGRGRRGSRPPTTQASAKIDGDQVGGLGRAPLQGLQDLADRLAVVVGGAPRRRAGRRRPDGARAFEQVLFGRRGRCARAAAGGLALRLGRWIGRRRCGCPRAGRLCSRPPGSPSERCPSGPSSSSGNSPCRPSPRVRYSGPGPQPDGRCRFRPGHTRVIVVNPLS